MATSSITHNFIITDPDEIERFAKALEESAAEPPKPCTVDYKYLKDPEELREFMKRRRAMLEAKEALEKEENSID